MDRRGGAIWCFFLGKRGGAVHKLSPHACYITYSSYVQTNEFISLLDSSGCHGGIISTRYVLPKELRKSLCMLCHLGACGISISNDTNWHKVVILAGLQLCMLG